MRNLWVYYLDIDLADRRIYTYKSSPGSCRDISDVNLGQELPLSSWSAMMFRTSSYKKIGRETYRVRTSIMCTTCYFSTGIAVRISAPEYATYTMIVGGFLMTASAKDSEPIVEFVDGRRVQVPRFKHRIAKPHLSICIVFSVHSPGLENKYTNKTKNRWSPKDSLFTRKILMS